jgi:hypothetical protein
MTSEAKNLKVICEAMDHHANTCGEPLIEIRLNPFEVERLDWQEIRGVPVKADDDIGTGRFKLICSGQHDSGDSVDAVAEKREVLA